jgi:nicotinamidase-related amidase
MKTCCEWLKNMIACAGGQGTAVVAIRDGERRGFYIQARALTQQQERTWERLLHTEPMQSQLDPLFRNEAGGLQAVVVGLRIPVLFCPHCGTNLEKFLRRHRDEFDVLAEAHQPFAMP